jgi:hypothetical protein
MLKRFLMLTTAVVAVVAVAAGFTFALFTSAPQVQTDTIQTGTLTVASNRAETAMWNLENIRPTTGRVNNLTPSRWEVANTGSADAWFRLVGFSRGDIFFCSAKKFDVYFSYAVVNGGITAADDVIVEQGEAKIGPSGDMSALADPEWFQPNVITVKVGAGQKLRMDFSSWLQRAAGNDCQGTRGAASMYILASQWNNNSQTNGNLATFPNAFTAAQAAADMDAYFAAHP